MVNDAWQICMKAVYLVDNPEVAKVLVDPMRRAILELLRIEPLTQAKLSGELGLSSPSLSYHMKALKSARLVVVAKREKESHGIMQKFFLPVAYLFVYDLDRLPKDIGRYFYPVSLERTRGMVSALIRRSSKPVIEPTPEAINRLSEKISESLVAIAKKYRSVEVEPGSEEIIYKIYADAIEMALK